MERSEKLLITKDFSVLRPPHPHLLHSNTQGTLVFVFFFYFQPWTFVTEHKSQGAEESAMIIIHQGRGLTSSLYINSKTVKVKRQKGWVDLMDHPESCKLFNKTKKKKKEAKLLFLDFSGHKNRSKKKKKKREKGKEQRGNMRRELSEWWDDDRERRGHKCRESNCVIERGVDKIPAREINETVEQLQVEDPLRTKFILTVNIVWALFKSLQTHTHINTCKHNQSWNTKGSSPQL